MSKAWQYFYLSHPFPEQKQHYFEEYSNRDWDPLRELLSNTIGVASFTDLHHCDLSWMWEHYGCHHNGCLIVFETSRMGSFFKIKYSEKRPKISIPVGKDIYPPDEVLAVLTTKEKGTKDHWEKECEWRMFDHLSRLLQMETKNGTIYLKAYPKSFTKVICGCNMSSSIFREVKKLADRKKILVEKEII